MTKKREGDCSIIEREKTSFFFNKLFEFIVLLFILCPKTRIPT